ncbi:hypothetical protein ScPMuIL_013649 [Solemya velum]
MGMRKRKTVRSETAGATRQAVTMVTEGDNRCVPPWLLHIKVSSVLGVCVLAVYIKTLYPSLPGGDSGELIPAAHELGVAHPPGYPLFTLVAWAAMKLIPFGSLSWRVNLITALTGAGAATLLSLTVMRQTTNMSAAILCVGLVCFGRLVWTWSVTAEVFAMNNFFIALLMVITVWFEETTKENLLKVSMIGAFVCGLSLCNQHTIVVYVVCIAGWVLTSLWKQQELTLRSLTYLSVSFIAGLVPYVYLPLSAYLSNARWTWGDQRSVAGLLKHLLRTEYGTFDLGKDETGLGLGYGLSAYMGHIQTDLTTGGFYLLFGGVLLVLYRTVREKRDASSLFLLMMVVYALFFAWRANLDVENPLLLGVVERFWMQSDIILFTIGIGELFRYVTLFLFLASYACRELGTAHSCSTTWWRNYPLCNHSNNTVVQDYAEGLLHSLPPNALVLTHGDISSNALRYFSLCEDIKPDVQVFEQEVLTYEWSVPMMRDAYPRITFPGDLMHLRTENRSDGRQSFNFKHFLDVNYPKYPIFACIGVQNHEPSWESGYELWPYGVCHRFVKKEESMNLEEWSDTVDSMARNWTYPLEGFDPRTWELIVTQEMWQAKISGAFFMYDRATYTSNVEQKSLFFTYSYKLYTRALESSLGFPSFWHKNYALVCHQLAFLSHNMNNTELVEKSVEHFSTYLRLEPNSEDSAQIRQSIDGMKRQLKLMSKMS